MTWVGVILVVVVVVVILAVGAAALRKAHASRSSRELPVAEASIELTEADRVRRIAPAAPMVGLESALDGVTDGDGRTLREQLDAGAPDVDQLRADNDTSPILRRALDHVAPAAGDGPSDQLGDEGTTNTTT